MKKILYLLISIAILFLYACDDNLTPEVFPGLTEEQVSKSYENTMARANALYTYLPNGLSYIQNGNNDAIMASACDEAEHTLETNAIQKFNTGSWNAVENPDNAWSTNFSGIYAANLFLANSDKVDMDYLKYDPAKQDQYKNNVKNLYLAKYQARFLRAFFYFELVKRYGGVPIFEKPLSLNSDFTKVPRNTLSECIKFIVDECDSAASKLPVIYEQENDMGRATKGAALALKSRVLLYAASDLFNDPSWAEGYPYPELISLTDDKTREERWQAAAEAADAVIRLSGAGYSLLKDYPNIFKAPSVYNSSEIIFVRRLAASNGFEKNNYPIGYDLGNSGTTPTGNLVDDYEVISGSKAIPFDWNNPEHAANPFAKRDPRLEYSILVNNEVFKGRKVECWAGGKDGPGTARSSRTGYYIKKYINPELDLLKNQTSIHAWILFRIGEFYLNYAEAVNEWKKSGNERVPGASLTARTAITNLRRRAGLPPVSAASAGYEDFREIVRHERRIELAFEGHRMWDVRRWMIAPETLGIPITGVEIKKTGEDIFEYKPKAVENRVFEKKIYFFPIPQKEIKIANWPQNPFW